MRNRKRKNQKTDISVLSGSQTETVNFLLKNADDISYHLGVILNRYQKTFPDWKSQSKPESVYWLRELPNIFNELTF